METLFTVPVIMRAKKGQEADARQYHVSTPEPHREHLISEKYVPKDEPFSTAALFKNYPSDEDLPNLPTASLLDRSAKTDAATLDEVFNEFASNQASKNPKA
jgi:hypothetical protein